MRPFFSAHQFFGILLCGISIALVSLLSLIFNVSTIPFFFMLLCVMGILLYIEKPLIFLALLIVIRMSLDFSAESTSYMLGDYSVSLSQILGLGITGIGLISVVRFRAQLFAFPLNTPFLIIFLWGLLSLSFSLSPLLGVQELLRLFSIWSISFLAYATVRSRDDARTLFFALFLSAFLPILFGIYQFINGIGLEDGNVSIPRIFGTFSHPNVFSLYLASLAGITILFSLSFAKDLKEKFYSGAYLILLVSTLILTYTRIGWIVLFLCFLFGAIKRFRLALIPRMLVPLLLYTFITPIRDRVDESLSPTIDSSLTWRQGIWHDTVSQTLADGNRSVFGYGMNTFPLVSENIRGMRLGSNDSHNDFVKFFVEGGYVGLMLFLFSLGLIARTLFITSRHAISPDMKSAFILTIFLFTILEIAALSDNVFKNTPVQWLFFITASILFALQRKK